MILLRDIMAEDLRKWFGKGGEGSTTGGGWDRYNTKGEKVGKCGDSDKGDSYAACLPTCVPTPCALAVARYCGYRTD